MWTPRDFNPKELRRQAYNKLENFLFEIRTWYLEEYYHDELIEFIKAGAKLQKKLEKDGF